MQGGGGIVIAKDRSTGAWSAPCAVGLAGISFGAQCGAELNEVVLILRNAAAVEISQLMAQVQESYATRLIGVLQHSGSPGADGHPDQVQPV